MEGAAGIPAREIGISNGKRGDFIQPGRRGRKGERAGNPEPGPAPDKAAGLRVLPDSPEDTETNLTVPRSNPEGLTKAGEG